MARKTDIYIDIEQLKKGLVVYEDTTKAPIGSAREMRNMRVTDLGGIGPRLGTNVLGTLRTGSNPIRGLYNFRKSFDQDEFLVKAFDDELEVFSKNETAADWFRLKDGFTADKEFGFVTSLVNTESKNFVALCNRFEEYQTWNGSVTLLNGALVGAETSVVVDSTLTDEVIESKTATANSASTLTVAGTPWADSQWIGLYVHITSGAEIGQVRRIISNTVNKITFLQLDGAPGNETFEVRMLDFAFAKMVAATIAFVDSDPDTITDSGNGFLNAGFKVNDRITISGSTGNNSTFTISAVTAGTITLLATDSLAAEGAGPAIVIVLEEMQIIYNGTAVAYTDIPSSTVFTVGSAHASDDNVGVASVPEVHPAAPRGNRLTNYLGRIIIGNVRSALARDNGGALQGFASAGSIFVSKLLNPFDFGFSGTRVAGEGDIISMPYGGGDITDVVYQEDTAYAFKARYAEAVRYSQDANDLANRDPLKSGIGSAGPVIKGSNDIYFVTADNRITTIGRVLQKDLRPETENLGISIKRVLDASVFGVGRGIEDDGRVYFPARSSSSVTHNDIIIVFRQDGAIWEGIWDMNANFMESFNNKLYFGESTSPNVFEMNVGTADVVGTGDEDRHPISASYLSNFMNLTDSHINTQGVKSVYFEGYIRPGSEITFKAFKDFATAPFLRFTFDGTEEALTDGVVLNGFLAGAPLGLRATGAFGEAQADGRVHFSFRVYFPPQWGTHFSFGWSSSDADIDYEVIRYGPSVMEAVNFDASRVKSI